MLNENKRKLETLHQILIFKGLTDDELNVVSDLLDSEYLQKGEVVFSQNRTSENVYIVQSGEVELSRIEKDGGRRILREYHAGDMFGVTDLYLDNPRYGTAVALTETELYSFSKTGFNWVLNTYPQVETYLKASKLPPERLQRLKLTWLNQGENINLITQRHPIGMIIRILGIAFLVSIVITLLVASITFLDNILLVTALSISVSSITTLVGLVISLITYLEWRNDYFIVTDLRVVWRERSILRKTSRREIPLRRIQSLSVKTTNTLARMIQVGDLIIRTFNSEMELKNVNRPDIMKNIIDGLLDKTQKQSFRSEQTAIRQTIRSQLGYEDAIPTPEDQQVQNPIEKQELQSTLFSTRIVEGGKITYRKHWWVFLKKAWLPSFGFVGTILLIMLFPKFVVNTVGLVGLIGLYTSPLIMILWWIYQYEDWRNDIYQVTKDRIIDRDKKPFGKESFRSAPINNIQSVGHEIPNTIGLLLNVGNVQIHVGEETLTFDGVYDPAQVHQDISLAMEKLVLDIERAGSKREHERMATWLEIYHEETEGKSKANPTKPSP